MNALFILAAIVFVQALVSNTLLLTRYAGRTGARWDFFARTIWGVLISVSLIPGSTLGLVPVIGWKEAIADLRRFPRSVRERVRNPKFF